ncbi:alpha/beta hydrolase [Phenylobacterium sp. LH3H17]|uniref:alpha/beta hydrolase n=1 Tax=Phenylobacterium sp. LH3H17 TaxID=2903901 RepID=UPI0020C96D5D|nr:alpha/beta hydrolase [Phenylobacterium sp. LH3H17]UTP38267.1 alpha/beta hydrolase [Phenylobacterium sp. LH3H17]
MPNRIHATELLWKVFYLRRFDVVEYMRADGVVVEKSFVEINGTHQGMIIESTDESHPVMLFLHGGPGMPEYFLNDKYPTGFEQEFTVVWWEQRGSGISYNSDIPHDTMTLEQLIADTIEVSNLLRRRFHKDKIYLLGHSWGSFLGIQVAAAAPNLFHAYVGMGQVSYQLRSEVEAHRYMLTAYRARGDAVMVRQLEAAPVSMAQGLSQRYLRLRDAAMHGLGIGTTRDMSSVISGVFIPVWKCRAYSLQEKVNIWRGVSFSRAMLWQDFIETNLTATVIQIGIPVYFFIGLFDYTANYGLAQDYFAKLKAPTKGFYTFQNSAHSPLFEEPLRARQILIGDVLAQRDRLAD